MAALTGLTGFVPRELQAAPIELLVQGAHCANCIAKIESGLNKCPGVGHVRFNLSTGKLTVAGAGLRAADIVGRIEALGFKAAPFQPSAALRLDEDNERFLLSCLAVATFGVAFVVPLTDATQALWFGVADMGPATRAALNWVVALVACPATLVASRPFFRSALSGLSAGRANMDVPISLAIVLSLGLSLYQSARQGAQTYFDAAVMLPFLLLIGRYLDLRVRHRASAAARQLIALQAVMVRRRQSSGAIETVMAGDIVRDDRLVLAAGERSPVDGTVESADATIDTSLVTGESAPVRVVQGAILRAGSIVLDRPIDLRVTAAVRDSLLADIARLVEAGEQARSRYVRLADRAARAYVPIVGVLALAVFVAWLVFLGASFATSVTNAVAVLIVTCPCALGLAAPAVQIVATGALFRRGIIVKSGDALERMAQVDVAIFDKTGTLTSDKLELCNRTTIGEEPIAAAAMLARASRHPLAQAVARAAGPGPIAPGIREREGAGLEANMNGQAWRLGRADWVGAAPDRSELPTLWFRRGTDLPMALRFEAPLRPDAQSTLAALSRRNVEPRILSGDRAEAVRGIAASLGVRSWKAGIDPKSKAVELNALKARGQHVLMIGDGINDAAALSLAHVSMSPASASDAAQSAADIVFNGQSLQPVVATLDIARQSRRRVLENFALAILYNSVAVPLAALGQVTPLIAAIAMASSSLLVTLNALRISLPRRGA